MRASWLVVAAVVAGCAVGPDYQAPAPATPGAWLEAPAADADLARWWTVFDDPKLFSLVERAVASNLDLRVADARVR
ncbi:MAG: efflux transporter outer membrane subunit, partial [Candidatus Binatia bacterium]